MPAWKIVLFVILGILAAFLVITLIRAAFFVPKKRTYEPLPDEKVDHDRVMRNLSQAIRIPTVSYPDPNDVDWAQFERFHAFLKEAYPLIHQTLSCEVVPPANLLYRWKGKDSTLDPIAMLAHQDVVPVEAGTEDDWTHPAYEGYHDGAYIWGRGALDMKNHLISVMEAVETLLEEGFEPERDVYLLFGDDEEVVASANSGARKLMHTLKERGVHLDSVLDEGGAILPAKVGGILNKYLAGIGVAEKGYADFEVSVSSKGGHSSQPPQHTALGELANVIRDLEDHQCNAKMTDMVYSLFQKIGRNVSYPARIVTCNLWLLKPLVLAVMKKIPPAASLVRTTTGVTMAQGSPAANVLPQKASVTVNFRMMPGDSIAGVERHIRKVVRNQGIEVKLLKGKEPSKISPTDSRCFAILEELCMRTNPDNIVAPYLVMGGTDACNYEPICDNIYRFAPFVVDPSLLLCTHSTDERVPVKALKEGVVFFKQYIRLASDK